MPELNDLLILMVVVWTAGKIFRSFHLPIVFGELVGGVIVGPALLGIVPADSEVIKVIAELGIFFLMLHSGLETNPEELLKASKKSIFVALGGVLLPFVGGYWAARFLVKP
ncbi:cation:proton antiporter [Candidatus Peregrinibacteria bacterium]|nr:MAG: cation:proton antiporter [Candidatus Peregrinibacteria bacterium]